MWFWKLHYTDGTWCEYATRKMIYGPKDICNTCCLVEHKSVWWYLGVKISNLFKNRG